LAIGSNLMVRAQRRLKRDLDWVTKRLLRSIPMAQASTLEGANWREIFPAETFEMARPAALNDNDWAVFQSAMKPAVPAARLIDLNDAFVFGEDSWIFDSRGVGVLGMWDRQGRMTEKQRIYALGDVSLARLENAERLAGVTLVLNQVVAGNFYHFVNQIMPRLAIAAQAIDLNAIDHFITPPNTHAFMYDLLGFAGVDAAKIRPMNEAGYRCERLIATSNPGPFLVPPKWANDYLRSIVPEAPSPVKSKRIFLARIDALKRRLINHDEIEKLLTGYGFEHVMLDGRPFVDQAAIFRDAELIVAVHGATLSHLIFAKPGTRVIELLPKNHVQPCFWTIGQMEGHHYSIILGSEKPLLVPKWRLDVDADLTIDPAELKAEVEKAIAVLHTRAPKSVERRHRGGNRPSC
jgi:capsular polysaccharide biosynthesis protein